jgi:4-hydroxybenzoate polyprenyltransferase
MNYISIIARTIRLKNWIKNILILVPIFFSSLSLSENNLIGLLDLFLLLSFSSSIIYILNDLIDLDEDQNDLIKKKRPIASGEISKISAISICFVLSIILSSYLLYKNNVTLYIVFATYFILNLSYSFIFKKIYFIDVIVLSLFYIIRVLAPIYYFNLDFSKWLVIIIFFAILSVGFGKRLMDLNNNKSNSNFISLYNKNELKIFILLSSTILVILFFIFSISENTIDKFGENFYLSFIIVIFGTIRYLSSLFKGNYTDPIEVFTKDKVLLSLVLFFGFYSLYCIYVL